MPPTRKQEAKTETEAVFHISWPGEPGAGIRPGYELVTIRFSFGWDSISWPDVIEDMRIYLRGLYDGATVQTNDEYLEQIRKEDDLFKEPK